MRSQPAGTTSIGYDLVSHCINDILVQGARPLFFLDYLAMGKLDTEVAASVISGMAEACREFGLALLGETADAGFYQPGDYDIAGTIVGVVEEDRILDGSRSRQGDRLVGLESCGTSYQRLFPRAENLLRAGGLSPR